MKRIVIAVLLTATVAVLALRLALRGPVTVFDSVVPGAWRFYTVPEVTNVELRPGELCEITLPER